MDLPHPVPKPKAGPEGPPLAKHEAQLPALGREPGIIAFAVLRDGREYVPTRLTIYDDRVAERTTVGPRGIYESTAYEYLMAAVMDYYRQKGLK